MSKLVPPVENKVLSPAEYQTCEALIRSSDPADWAILQQVLLTLNKEKNIIEIHKLAKINWYRMVNLRTRFGRDFNMSLQLSHLCSLSGRDMLTYLDKRGWLTPERFEMFKEKTLRDFNQHCCHPFYEVKIELRPEYKHLDPQDTLAYNPFDKSVKHESTNAITS